jgi:reactive intermediate/imine deaminase
MMQKTAVHTDQAPAALGPYSQGIRVGDTVYISGQLGLVPATGALPATIDEQAHQAFQNIRAIAQAAGGDLDGIVKLTLLMADLSDFAKVNDIMTTYFTAPYPARATYQVAALPKAGRIEVEAVLVLTSVASAQTGWRETFDATKAA